MRSAADLIRDFVVEVIGAPCDVLGHSFGAWLALWFATKHEEHVHKLILEAPAGILRPRGTAAAERGAAESALFAHPERARAYLKPKAVRDANRIAALHYHKGVVPDDELLGLAKNLTRETLVMLGSKDTIVPAEVAGLLELTLPRCSALTIEDAAHNLELDQPEAFASAVSGYLSVATQTPPNYETVESVVPQAAKAFENSSQRTRTIAVVGGREASLSLALGLQRNGFRVTLMSSRNWQEISSGSIMTSNYTFGTALELDRRLGVNYWEAQAPRVTMVDYATVGSTETSHSWKGRLARYAQSVDQRVKLPHMMREFERLGGVIRIGHVDEAVLEDLTAQHDLVVIGAGRQEVAKLFPPNETESRWHVPRRTIAIAHVRGMTHPDGPHKLVIRSIPGLGEYSTMPALTSGGVCDIMMFQAIPNRELDQWEDVHNASDHINRSLELLQKFLPDEAQRCSDVEPTDVNATLIESLTPRVREPVLRLPSGGAVLGLADAVVLNEPLAGQGASGASRAADVYLDAIIENAGQPYTESWMLDTFNRYWRGYAQWAVRLTDTLLDPVSPHLAELFADAGDLPSVGDAIADGFDDPSTLWPWFFRADEAREFVSKARELASSSAVDIRELRRSFAQFATGVTVVATKSVDLAPVGLTVNSFTSVSLEPPLVLWCGASRNPSINHFQVSDRFSVNVLSSSQGHLSRQFSTPLEDKFVDVNWVDSKHGMPFIDGAVMRLSCVVEDRHIAGDHIIYIGRIEEMQCEGGEPLVFHSGTYQIVTHHFGP